MLKRVYMEHRYHLHFTNFWYSFKQLCAVIKALAFTFLWLVWLKYLEVGDIVSFFLLLLGPGSFERSNILCLFNDFQLILQDMPPKATVSLPDFSFWIVSLSCIFKEFLFGKARIGRMIRFRRLPPETQHIQPSKDLLVPCNYYLCKRAHAIGLMYCLIIGEYV